MQKQSIASTGNWSKSEELTAAETIAKGVDYIYSSEGWERYVRIAALGYLAEFIGRLDDHSIDTDTQATEDTAPTSIATLPAFCINLDEVCSRIGIDQPSFVNDLHKIAKHGFFMKHHRVVPLLAAQRQRCNELRSKFDQFLGEGGWSVSQNSLAAFVRQFPAGLRGEVIDLLDQVVVVDRGKTYSSMKQVAANVWARVKMPLVFCRFSPNSGNYVSMLFEADAREEMRAEGHEFAKTVGEAQTKLEANANRHLIFVDDQFATGGQARAQLWHWAGRPRHEWPRELQSEQNIDTSDIAVSLREAMQQGMSLGFSYGTPEGREAILQDAQQLGFRGLAVEYRETIEPQTRTMSVGLRKFLIEVGVQVLNHCRNGGKDISSSMKKELTKDALGYNEVASLLITPNNVPSHAITALWCPGIVNRQPWVPLFVRRGYKKHLVLG